MLGSAALAGDLYKAAVTSPKDAELLNSAGVEPVYRLSGAYLVLADDAAVDKLKSSGVNLTLLASNVSIDHLAIDNRLDRANVGRFDLVFEEGGLRVFRVPSLEKTLDESGASLLPVDNDRIEIVFESPFSFNSGFRLGEISLDSLIGLVSLDSLDANLHTLETYGARLTGSAANYAARDWIEDGFTSYGLDSVVLDSFTGTQLGNGVVPAYNVIAYKIGSRYPGRQVVVGGHFDAVPGSPGVDDNGSGTIGTMEIARVLNDVETEMTFIFIAFDSEESGLIGAKHYASAARARGDTIVYMLNMDMIGHIDNDAYARLYIGPNDEPYALLWGKLADSLVGITGVLIGPSSGSDHAPFAQYGYDVTFVHEYTFSSHYHQRSDSTTYINFDYMTRMIKGSLATVYAVNLAPPPVIITAVSDVGDGQSLEVSWPAGDAARIDHYWLHYTTVPATQPDSIQIPVDSSRYRVDGLTENQEYSFHIIAVDQDGRTSLVYQRAYGTPRTRPAMPDGLLAQPLRDSIKVIWRANNTELDFDHYGVIRDGQLLPDYIIDTVFIDGDPSLGIDLHDYVVVATDIDGNVSDTAGAPHVQMKAAQLTANRILALNRSASNDMAMVNEAVTGEFLREALTGWSYDYFSDTAANNPNRADLLRLIDYGLVVIGAESGRGQDDIGDEPSVGGILEEIVSYMSIGGKVIVFGRWGNFNTVRDVDTLFYSPGTSKFLYTQYFNTAFRILPITYLDVPSLSLQSDFIGAHGQLTDYPDLVWDQPATRDHTGSAYTTITGIPCPSIPYLIGPGNTVIYTYNSSSDSALTEGKPIAWQHLGGTYKYIFFDIPLSFMQREAAVAALRQAVMDMGIASDVADGSGQSILPTRFALSQNYPNPFNPRTIIEFYNPQARPAKVTLEVFNILGQRVRLLFDGSAMPGLNRLEWDGRDDLGQTVASGIYFYRLESSTETLTRKMVLLK